MVRSFVAGLLAGGISFVGAAHAASQLACWPVLEFKDVRFSEMQPPRNERKWTAVLAVDASRCATTSGRFAIVFSRAKENGMTVDFQEQFTWRATSVEVSLDFWSDEAVERYWLNNVEPCPCAR
ncbi:MAG: hypothetical protein HY060_12910 [Proteobacteria bacterium]|nr:hypothetical protein [Pseudomonadota bacterium]